MALKRMVSSESIELPERPAADSRAAADQAGGDERHRRVIRAKHDEASIEREPAHRRSHGLL
jgi:hypothetical protein